MRFSIRSLLAVMLISAVVFPLVITLQRIRQQEALQVQLANEIQSQRQRLGLDDPLRTSIYKRQHEARQAIATMRAKAEEQFAKIQAKYSVIEPPGDETLALRTIPQLGLDNHYRPVVFRLAVPKNREVWFKYTLVHHEYGSEPSSRLDRIRKAPEKSGYAHSGPFEIKLPPGDQQLKVHAGPPVGDSLPIRILLNDTPLLVTTFSGDGTPSTGSYHISGRQQVNFGPKRELPWLLNVRVRLNNENQPSTYAEHAACTWLSDVPSGYDPFPGSQLPQETRP